MRPLGKVDAGSRERTVLQRDDSGGAAGVRGITQMDLLYFVAKCAQVAAGIDDSAIYPLGTQRLHRAIDREPFRDSAEIDRKRSREANEAARQENDVAKAALSVALVVRW